MIGAADTCDSSLKAGVIWFHVARRRYAFETLPHVDIVHAKTEAEYFSMLPEYFGLEISGNFPYSRCRLPPLKTPRYGATSKPRCILVRYPLLATPKR